MSRMVDTAGLPAGVAMRPFAGDEDLKVFVEIANAANAEDRVEERTSFEALHNWASHPSRTFDAAKDLAVVTVDDKPIAYGWTGWVDSTDGVRTTRPAATSIRRGDGRGSAPPSCGTTRRACGASRPSTGRIGPASTPPSRPESRLGAVALVKEQGYQPVRYFFDMVRPTLDEIVVPDLPEGVEIRPVAGRDQMRQLFDADVEAFLDHWGGFDATDAAFEQWLADPDYEPRPLRGGAGTATRSPGSVTNVINERENAELGRLRGLLDSVSVRRPWRGRGLGYALVMRSLELLRERGMTSAWLGVDAENPTGALRLYEKAGFVGGHPRGRLPQANGD